MRPSSALHDSNYGVRSLSDSFSDGSDSSSIETLHQDDLLPISTPSSQASTASSVYGSQSEPSTSVRDCSPPSPRQEEQHAPLPSRVPPLPLLSSTSPPVSFTPPLSPVNSYSSISSTSSPPNYLSDHLMDSVSSLGSLQAELTSSNLSSATPSSSRLSEARHQRQAPQSDEGEGSNGNLVLPMLPSGLLGRDQEEDEVERELREAESSNQARPTSLIASDFKIVVVAGREEDRELLLKRLAVELGVELEQGTDQKEGWEGRRGRSASASEQGDAPSRDIWIGTAGNDLSSVERLLEHVQSRHLALAHQLSPRSDVPSLGVKDVLQLASTGKGRGPGGWIDCSIVVVEDDAPTSSLSAARILSSFTPTLLVLLRSDQSLDTPQLASVLHRLELVSPSLLPIVPSTTGNLLILERSSLSDSHTLDESISEGLPTPQPGNDEPFSFTPSREDPTISPLTFSQGIHSLFGTEHGLKYLHRFAARGFMRYRAAIPPPSVVPTSNADTTLPTDSLSSSMTSDAFLPRPWPGPIPLEIEEPSFDPLHLPSAVSNLLVPSLKRVTSFVLEGLGIIAIGVLSVVAQSVFLGVVGEVARRLDLRGAFGRSRPWTRC